MNSIMLVMAMSAGQGPGNVPAVLPGTVPMPMNVPMPMTEQPGAATPAPTPATNGNGSAAPCEACEPEEPAEEPWALMRVLKGTTFGDRLDDCGINIYGWTQGNYTLSTTPFSNAPMAFNNRADFWQMNQNYLVIDRAVDTSKDKFQLGFRADLILPGTDAQFTPARGLLDDQTGAYRIDLFQAYIDAYMPGVGPNGTTFRVGKFATHVGYELVQGALTPFVSRSYNFQYNPFTHTGVNAITGLNDNWTVSNGIVLGSDNFIGAPARPTYIGQLAYAPPEGKTSAFLNAVVTGPTYDQGDQFAFYNYYGMVLSHKFTEKFTGVADVSFSHMNGVPDVGGTTWYGGAVYGIYQISEKLVSTVRAELFEDSDGVRTGFSGLYTEVTAGLAWSPIRSLIFRPSVRYDYNNRSRPFDGDSSMWTGAFEMIVRW